MKKSAITLLLVLALSLGVFGSVSNAVAFPTKTRACSNCHATRSTVKITLTRLSLTKTTAKYSIKVSGGSGVAGWALFSGSTNIARRTSSTGTFTITRGRTYKVWAVKSNTGSRSMSLLVAK